MSNDVTPCQTMSHHVTPCQTMSNHVTPCQTMSNDVTPCKTMSHHVTPCHTKSHQCTSWKSGTFGFFWVRCTVFHWIGSLGQFRWHVTHDKWHMTHDTSHITYDMWRIVFFSILVFFPFCPFWYWCYYLHLLRDSLSPVWGIFIAFQNHPILARKKLTCAFSCVCKWMCHAQATTLDSEPLLIEDFVFRPYSLNRKTQTTERVKKSCHISFFVCY